MICDWIISFVVIVLRICEVSCDWLIYGNECGLVVILFVLELF